MAVPVIYGIAIARAGIAVLTYVSPATSAELFGLGNKSDTSSDLISRLFASRDIALGGAMVLAQQNGDNTQVAELAKICCVVDALDTVAAGIAYSRGDMTQRAFWLAGVGAAAFAATNYYIFAALKK